MTWNRRDLLLECLGALLGQDPAPGVIVVDNASSDGTAEAVTGRFPQVDLLRCGKNIGGAGGFALGIARALDAGCDLVWLMDDDTVPGAGALAALLDARERYAVEPGGRVEIAPPVLLASKVVWTDGREHPMNTPRPKPGARAAERRAAMRVGCVAVRTASFVSVLLSADRVREVGLPIADYFLWNDDFEYSARVVRGGRALYCPASVVVHKTRTFGSTDADPGPRFYYEVRNKVWTFGRTRSLGPVEKGVYAASTARRWARTILRSDDRRTLLRGLARGLRDGMRRPRTTLDVVRSASPSLEPESLAHLGGPARG